MKIIFENDIHRADLVAIESAQFQLERYPGHQFFAYGYITKPNEAVVRLVEIKAEKVLWPPPNLEAICRKKLQDSFIDKSIPY